MKKLLVIDGNSIVNRAFYGIRLLTNKNGVYTNAIFGMVNIIMKQIESLEPDYCAIAFDLKAPTFRHERFGEYKAGRHATPPELLAQFPYAKTCAKALGMTVLEREGYEADDILGTLSAMAEKESVEAYVLTGDRDSLQLITDTTRVLLATNTDTVLFDKAAFFEKYGVDASQFVDVKALMGDSSDNIPGVAGIGEKTALKLISEFGSLESLYSALPAPTLTKGVNEKLEKGKESASLSQFLARIYTEVPLDITLDEVAYNGLDEALAYELFTELEFSAFIKRFGLNAPETALTESAPCEKKQVGAEELLAALAGKETVGVLFGEKLSFADSESLYEYTGDVAALAPLFADDKKQFVCYDCKTLYKNLEEAGISFRGAYHDVMLGAYVLSPAESSFSFERLCALYLGQAVEGEDIALLLPLYREIENKIKENGQEALLYDIEMPLAAVLADMELAGCKVDLAGLAAYGERLAALEEEYRERIYMHAGREFNINSPKQLGEVLFDWLKLPGFKKTKNGYSTNAEILEKLRPYHPIIEDILDYRQVAKLRGTYAEGLAKNADNEGIIHTHFKQTGTATGRLSSTEPNLQNIPIKTELGREFRRFFVPREEGRVLIDADYSQIELRLLADIAGDETMIHAFKMGEDIHTATAAKVFGVAPEEVTTELRKRAKAVNFGIVYGIGDFSLAEDLHTSRAKAKEYIESYLATYPAIDAYLKNIIKSAYECGFVTTVFGRRRYIPELKESNKMRRAFGERVAMNSPIQGTAADIIKIAMIKVDKRLREEKLDARLILQVHDELLIEASESVADEVLALLREEMENAVALTVPLDVEVGVGMTWFECH